MATATLIRRYRPSSIKSDYTVPAFADLVLNSATFKPGDTIRVLASGRVYTYIDGDTFVDGVAGSTPLDANVPSFRGYSEDFSDLVGIAVADTAASVVKAGTGLRIHGQGLAETDSGVTVAAGAGGPVASVLTTDEAAHLTALSFGSDTELWDPATYGPIVVEAEVAMSSALTERAFFLGFIGASIDALDPVVTGSTTTLTLVADDVSGLFYDSGLTAATRLYAAHNKANEAATIATTDTGVDTGTVFPAAGTYIKLKVVISAAGKMTCYADGVQIAEIAASASTTVPLNPILYVESNAASVKTMLVKSFKAYSLA